MVLRHHFVRWSTFVQKAAIPAFVIVCVAGFLLGTLYGASTLHWYPMWIRTAAESGVSFWGFWIPSLLPLLIAGYALYIEKPQFLYLICFIKTFAFAHCAFSAVAAFGQAGWLVRFLFQFSDIFSIPVLFWLSLRHITGNAHDFKRDLVISASISAVFCGIDYCIVSPFLAMLIEV